MYDTIERALAWGYLTATAVMFVAVLAAIYGGETGNYEVMEASMRVMIAMGALGSVIFVVTFIDELLMSMSE
jgi:hypothetical protein